MNNLLDSREEDNRRPPHDREISLGTTMILLIFFALALYGAALFGFGYSLGSKHVANTSAALVAPSSPIASVSKPAPGSPLAIQSASADRPLAANPLSPDPSKPVLYTPPVPTHTVTVAPETSSDDVLSTPKPAPPASPAPAPSAPAPMPALAVPSGTFVVQVAALSHQEDAELIASTLRHRGYAVTLHPEADKLIHIQVGPFATRKDAEAMKARLLADGFNAYIK